MKDGSIIIDKFVGSSSKYLTLENHKRILWKDIKKTTINKDRKEKVSDEFKEE